MQDLIVEDPYLKDFFNYLYIERGLSQNTVKSYKRDIDSFILWSQEYKKSTEQYTMTYSEYKKKWLKEKRRNSNGHR